MAAVEYVTIGRLVPAIAVSMFWGVVVLFAMTWKIVKLGPRQYFWIKKRDKLPEVLNDDKLGTHHYARMKRIRLHYVARGPDDKPLMLFLHGFPEFWYSWRFQLKEFSKEFRTVAVDMRGCGESEKPPYISDYHMSKLTDDIKEFVEYLGYSKCILVSHDWGGVVGWMFAAKYPDMVEKFVACNSPNPIALLKHIRTSWKQFRMVWYMFFFQIPWLPEIFVGGQDLALLSDVFTSLRQKGSHVFGEDDLEAYKYNFKNFDDRRSAINYYRASVRYKPEKLASSKVHCPTLIIWGERDFAMEKASAEQSKQFVDNECTVRFVENGSHWIQQEEPELVNQYIREFLQ